ncbi:hypothetical protein HPK19_20340 [Arthrobacter citreus]|nr:hypothetical protein HPK19_20340 [Arthrobacter citreus]
MNKKPQFCGFFIFEYAINAIQRKEVSFLEPPKSLLCKKSVPYEQIPSIYAQKTLLYAHILAIYAQSSQLYLVFIFLVLPQKNSHQSEFSVENF